MHIDDNNQGSKLSIEAIDLSSLDLSCEKPNQVSQSQTQIKRDGTDRNFTSKHKILIVDQNSTEDKREQFDDFHIRQSMSKDCMDIFHEVMGDRRKLKASIDKEIMPFLKGGAAPIYGYSVLNFADNAPDSSGRSYDFQKRNSKLWN